MEAEAAGCRTPPALVGVGPPSEALPGSPSAPSIGSDSLATEAEEVSPGLASRYSALVQSRRNSSSFLRMSTNPIGHVATDMSGIEGEVFLDAYQKVLRGTSQQALSADSRQLSSRRSEGGDWPPSGRPPPGSRPDGRVAWVARSRVLAGAGSVPTLARFRLGEEVEEGSPRSASGGDEGSAEEGLPPRPRAVLPRPQAAAVAPVFRLAESFLPEPSVQERRLEDVQSYHKELLASEVGMTTVLPRARAPSMPALLDRKELSGKVRRKYPARDWHPQAPEARSSADAMQYYSVKHNATWSMPSRGAGGNQRRVVALRPWDDRPARTRTLESKVAAAVAPQQA